MAQVRCSICGRSFDSDESPAMPFCSERCRLVDLGRWLDEDYGVPWEREDPEEEPDGGRPPEEP
jgi:endogenous inhibitor of DNA gyrase (YacG/DUF329 family)